MDLIEAIGQLDSSSKTLPKREVESARMLVEKGPVANGRFPSSLGAIKHASSLLFTPDVRPENLVNLLLSDPVMVIRLLSLVNHSFYNRGQKITVMNRAITHVGLMSLGKVLEDLGDAKSFSAVFLGRATSAIELQKTILSSFIAKAIIPLFDKKPELTEKAASTAALSGLVPLLLSYFKPNIHCGISLEAEASKNLKYPKIIRKVFGDSVTDIAAKMAAELGLPEDYANYMLLSDLPPWNRRSWGQKSAQETRMIVSSSYLGRHLAESLALFEPRNIFHKTLKDTALKLHIKYEDLEPRVAEAVVEYFQVMAQVGIKAFRLPSHYY
ncbi:MAG: HDOD domain-containing protein [Bdellovibrionota bacterium]